MPESNLQRTAESEPQMYSPAQFAPKINVTPRTVLNMINDGRIRAIRLGKTIRIPASELERILSSITPAA